ncbi:MAG: YbjN domain-containing protein [Pseudomonadota bacterium]
MDTQLETLEEDIHPLDNVEDVLASHNWTFNRMNDDEIIVEVTGKSGKYNLFFVWQEDMNALQFCAQLDLKIMDNNHTAAREALLSMNESLWMGHFDLPKETGKPSYRYTQLFRGGSRIAATETIEDMVDISMAQCERHFPLFTLLASANDLNDQTLSLALMDTAGES